nr:D-tyrosyl-tRNA(Tyr) deacylase [Desulfuromonadales bacterium]
MKAVVQRVSSAAVKVDGVVRANIGAGYLVLVGVAPQDGSAEVEALADKLVHLRLMADADGKMNVSVLEAGGSILLVSQFTLEADIRKGRRPSFTSAAQPEVAEPLIESLAERIAELGVNVSTGVFGAYMEVELVNDGPVTLVVEVAEGSVK